MTSPETRVEASRKRVRAYLGGHLVADSTRPLLVWEVPYYPAYYFPQEDVLASLVATEDPTVFDVRIGDVSAPGAAFRDPVIDAVRINWRAMDEWLEEDEPVYGHPRNPYSRVDILDSSRHVRVVVDGVTVAETVRPRILFETGLPPRYYMPLSDIETAMLVPSQKSSVCPYKGTASYWSVEVNGTRHDDLVWMYRAPLPESQKIAGLACFYNERVDLYVDGELQS